ncbi:MAG: ribosome-binding factor A [Epulopiscium sp. Nele67-Bin001]|nr:MAG: ribosome-binding factor A [Epulopiscium sp. Nuni2H_MBin001]OON93855.1 MAG: ribosome-binding factor A [Epulopiscium sp. Nele67-Bin001]
MANQRIMRVNEEIKREIAELVREEIKDPRVNGTMVSVTAVETTSDLKSAKIFISVLQEDKQSEVIEALQAASKFIRKEVAKRLNLRNTPELTFKADDSIAYGMKMSQVIHEVMSGN